jgi:CheY-like chemotaxis protein
VFTLEFPAGNVPVEQSPHTDGPAPTALRVLVVDDEEAVLSVLAEMLRGGGHQVATALGGLAAIETLRGQSFDVVFTDLGMPEVTGWDLASIVKARRPECAVVLVSGWGFQLEEEAAHSRGVDRVMAKPFSFGDVEATLRALFASGGQRREAA